MASARINFIIVNWINNLKLKKIELEDNGNQTVEIFLLSLQFTFLLIHSCNFLIYKYKKQNIL